MDAVAPRVVPVSESTCFVPISVCNPPTDAEVYVAGLRKCFELLKDPRVQGRCDHLLLDVLAIAILAMLCGAEDWPDIEEFGKRRHDWLKMFLSLPGGIPSHDTFRRIFGLLNREQFSQCLFQWTQALHKATGGKLIAIDGKTARRSFAKKSGLGALHLVTAWASENSLTLGQIACAEKSNEITAIPELLKLLQLKGCTVTIDAMGCQKEIAAQIRDQGGHYLLALKGNQSGLESDMQQLFEEAMDSDFAGMKHATYETDETGHGRRERRSCDVLEIPAEHPQCAAWKDLHTLVVVTSHREIGGHETSEVRYYVSSHGPQARRLAIAVRKHWGIENTQHWSLDVTFGEDTRRQQDRNGAANLGAVRRLALSLLRQEKTNKRGLKNKRLACALDPNYLLHVLANAKF
jgi:predicted transposase YbfD/YdcC